MKRTLLRNGKWVTIVQRRHKQHPLAEIVESQQEGIKRFKWIESEKAGHDIGWERAAREWSHSHFPEWKHHHWGCAIADALREHRDALANEGSRVYDEG